MFTVYILYSKKLNRFYTGFSQDFALRKIQHRISNSHWTGQTKDWKEIFQTEVPTRQQARALEKRIKARGAKRFLDDMRRRCHDSHP